MIYATLYKQDTKGSTRVWFMERDGDKHRTHAGLLDGKLAVSGWTVCTPKSQPTAEDQAHFEVLAEYKKKLDRSYHDSIDTIAKPKIFQPMLAHKYEGWQGSCFSQPKLDGIRCIATKDGLFSRQGKPIVAVPHIEAALKNVFDFDPTVVLDGELYNHDLKDDFNTITSLVRKQKPTDLDLAEAEQKIQFWVYDVPSVAGSFGARLDFLCREVFPHVALRQAVHVVETASNIGSETVLDAIYANYLEAGYEGQMVRLDRPYENKRSSSLLKRKEFQDAEFKLIRIEEGLGNWSGVAKRVVAQLPDGREFGAGIRGTRDRAAELLHETYDEVTIRFFALTPDGVPRFPVATAFHAGERL